MADSSFPLPCSVFYIKVSLTHFKKSDSLPSFLLQMPGCSGGLLSGPEKRCEHSLYLGKLIHDLLVDL